MKSKKKLYVLVDNALRRPQKAVQAAHAVAEYLLSHPNTEWSNGTLVLLRTDDLERYLHHAESYFREPDLRNKITALTFLGGDEKVKDLRLL